MSQTFVIDCQTGETIFVPYSTADTANQQNLMSAWQAEQQQAANQATAKANLQTLLAQQATFASQIQTDAAMFQGTAVGSTLQQEHIDALVRMVNGFSTTMGAIVDHLTVNGIT